VRKLTAEVGRPAEAEPTIPRRMVETVSGLGEWLTIAFVKKSGARQPSLSRREIEGVCNFLTRSFVCAKEEKKGTPITVSENYDRFEKDKKECGTCGCRMSPNPSKASAFAFTF
jgi:hypothetical protein